MDLQNDTKPEQHAVDSTKPAYKELDGEGWWANVVEFLNETVQFSFHRRQD